MEFPKNKLKATLKAGKPAVGTFLNVPSPNIVEMLGYAGLDFVIIDFEHGRPNQETMENMVRAADVSGLTSIVRIPNGLDRSHYVHALDSGAMGVQVPMVDDAETAEIAVKNAKYFPRGFRGLAGGRATKYGGIALPEYVKQANAETMVIAQIETVQAADNAEVIAAVDGIDLIFIGPTDLGQSMGYPGMMTRPELLEKVDDISRRVISAAGKPVGCLTGSVEVAAEQVKKGMQYLCIPAVNIFNYCKTFVEAVRKF